MAYGPIFVLLPLLIVLIVIAAVKERQLQGPRQIVVPQAQAVLVTMPDGTQQMAVVAQPIDSLPDARSFGFAALGFFFPVVGLILWLVWKAETPLKAKSAGTGALVGTCIGVGLSLISFVVMVMLLNTL
jgi:hypothetical protein